MTFRKTVPLIVTLIFLFSQPPPLLALHRGQHIDNRRPQPVRDVFQAGDHQPQAKADAGPHRRLLRDVVDREAGPVNPIARQGGPVGQDKIHRFIRKQQLEQMLQRIRENEGKIKQKKEKIDQNRRVPQEQINRFQHKQEPAQKPDGLKGKEEKNKHDDKIKQQQKKNEKFDRLFLFQQRLEQMLQRIRENEEGLKKHDEKIKQDKMKHENHNRLLHEQRLEQRLI